MKYILLILISIFIGCSNSSKIIKYTKYGKFIYTSGNISGVDYIIIKQKLPIKNQFLFIINCNHYFKDLGYLLYITKAKYTIDGQYFATLPFVKDSLVLTKMNIDSLSNFTKLSHEEYELIKIAFNLYPKLAIKYNLNADSLKNHLGWLEIKK